MTDLQYVSAWSHELNFCLKDRAAFQDLCLAPAHQAILGASAAPSQGSNGTAASAGVAANAETADLYADLDLPATTADSPKSAAGNLDSALSTTQAGSMRTIMMACKQATLLFIADRLARLALEAEQTDPPASALLQHALQMLASAELEEQNLAAEMAAAYSRLAAAQVGGSDTVLINHLNSTPCLIHSHHALQRPHVTMLWNKHSAHRTILITSFLFACCPIILASLLPHCQCLAHKLAASTFAIAADLNLCCKLELPCA